MDRKKESHVEDFPGSLSNPEQNPISTTAGLHDAANSQETPSMHGDTAHFTHTLHGTKKRNLPGIPAHVNFPINVYMLPVTL